MSIKTAIILAAGTGSRLHALGREQPKGFLRLGEQPIIVESLMRLQAVGVERVLLVTGHQAGCYQQLAADLGGLVRTLHNPLFDQSGSLYSLLLAAAEPLAKRRPGRAPLARAVLRLGATAAPVALSGRQQRRRAAAAEGSSG